MECLFSSGPHPCMPCVRCFSGSDSHHSPSFASHPSPSCGTCDGGRSSICCGVMKVERLKGHSNPGSWWQLPCHPFWGWPWRNPPQPLSPPPLLGMLSGTPAAFLEASPRHTFLWVCRAEEEKKACFRHFPHL